MKNLLKSTLKSLLLAIALPALAHASTTVEIYNWPATLPSGLAPWSSVGNGSSTGVIQVRPTDQSTGWQNVTVFEHEGYHYAYDGQYDGYTEFGSNGSVDVKIVYKSSLTTQTFISPTRQNITYTLSTTNQSNDTVIFTLPTNGNVLFCPSGNTTDSLAIFNNPLSSIDNPGSTAANTDYYAPGTVTAYRHTSDSNIYVAPGAIVTLASSYPLGLGSNMTLYGYGIVLQTANNQVVQTGYSSNVTMKEVILDNQSGPPGSQGNWTWDVNDTTNLTANNVKIFDQSFGEDAIDLDRDNTVTIENCFIRVDDDGVALKATTYNSDTTQSPTQNVTIENNYFWIGSFGNLIHIGALNGQESYSSATNKNFTNIVVNNNDAMTNQGSPGASILNAQTDEGASINQVTIENTYVDSSYYVFPATLAVSLDTSSSNTGVGSISNITIENLVFNDTSYLEPSPISGYSSSGMVSNVTFQSIYENGALITNPASVFTAGSYTSNITLNTSSAFFTESFDYSPGNLNGNGSWSGPTAYQVESTNLNYTDSTGASLVTSGGSAQVASYYPGAITDALPQTIGTPGTTVYWSFIYSGGADDSLNLVDSTGNYRARVAAISGTWQIYANGTWNNSGVTASGHGDFLVVRLDFSSSSTEYRLYVNPKLSSESANTASVNVTDSFTGTLNSIAWYEGYYTNQILDEIRMGASWTAVTPSTGGAFLTESFKYSAGNLTGNGGWSGPTAYQVVSNNLSYTDSTGASLTTAGGSAQVASYYPGAITDTLPQTIGAAGTTVYWSFIYSGGADDSLNLVDTTGNYHARAAVISGTWQLYANGAWNNSGVTASGHADFLVVRLDFISSGTQYRLYVNPKLSGESANTASVNVSDSFTGTLNSIAWYEGYYTNQILDEIRMGNSWAAVTPDPPAPSNASAKGKVTVTPGPKKPGNGHHR